MYSIGELGISIASNYVVALCKILLQKPDLKYH
jgi:hypothetical protein